MFCCLLLPFMTRAKNDDMTVYYLSLRLNGLDTHQKGSHGFKPSSSLDFFFVPYIIRVQKEGQKQKERARQKEGEQNRKRLKEEDRVREKSNRERDIVTESCSLFKKKAAIHWGPAEAIHSKVKMCQYQIAQCMPPCFQFQKATLNLFLWQRRKYQLFDHYLIND